MIYLYSGTPGSGKSLDAIRDIVNKLKNGGNVIANFPIKLDLIKPNKKKDLGKFIYLENDKLTVKFLTEFALKNHTKGIEGQTLIVFDEAQAKFNSRDFRSIDRQDYNHFFSLHRHLGYNVILITQNDRLIDKQIRCLIEYEVKHRKINNFKTIGKLLPFCTFACITYWYGIREKVNCEFFTYKKKLSALYDSYALFDVVKEEENKINAPLSINSLKSETEKENVPVC